ncbi:MAG: LytTR family DNA-binding domain-containing protein [Proteobacteria bacterium]|nr:LytTR family DNA-binding domain-containing protein [Pseudomonadota bacterium]MBU1688821.1 LytTR family DNA-binding domain-containing protein [Pseudomonadota bacterium]
MKPVRALIADDEAILRTHLRTTLTEIWPDLELCGEAENGIEARDLILKTRPDIAFLDIRMPGLTGLEVAAEAPEQCRIVFITAYDQYAIEAFDHAALDYLLKPLSVERLTKTVARLRQEIQAPPGSDHAFRSTVESLLRNLGKPVSPGFLDWIKVRHGEGIKLLPVDEISFFRASDKYTEVMTASAEHLIRISIKQLAEQLDPAKFWQIHRKTMVNVGKITKVNRSLTGRFVVSLADRPEQLTVSRSYTHLFRQM